MPHQKHYTIYLYLMEQTIATITHQREDPISIRECVCSGKMIMKSSDFHYQTWSEDATFYPGLCDPIHSGGLGFDYFVCTQPAEMWLWLFQNGSDEHWIMSQVIMSFNISYLKMICELLWSHNWIQSSTPQIVDTLTNYKSIGKMIVYAENHMQVMEEKYWGFSSCSGCQM